eukprot:g18080.t2
MMLQDVATKGRDDALVAFSVHGLGASDRPGVASEGVSQQQREAPAKKGWLSSFNTVVVGDRPETVTLMLTLSAPTTTTNTAAVTTSGAPGTPPPPSMIRRATGDQSPSTSARKTAAISRQAAPILLYQSELRPFGQQPASPALSRSVSPSGPPQGVQEGVGGKGRAATMAGEGIVHFSVPARVSAKFSGGGEQEGVGAGGDSGEGAVGAVFVVELWQVVNRARRVLVGSMPLSWEDLMAVPTDPRKCGVFSGIQSERYPSSFLAVRRIASPLPQPLSLTVGGVANHAVERFNPMVTFFTALRRSADTGPEVEVVPDLAARDGFPVQAGGGASDFGGGVGAGGGADSVSAPVSSSAEGWELVVCQELAVECKFTFKLPLQLLHPVHVSLKEAASAWRLRARRERDRQGLFELDEEAFANGMVLVRVSVSRARGLGAVAAMAAAAAASGTTTAGGSPVDRSGGGGSGGGGQGQLLVGDAAGSGAASNLEQQHQVSGEQGVGGERGGGGGGGRGLGGLGGLGLEGAKMSSSMRKFGGRMKGMGVKAVAMARIASQASPAAHLRLGAVSTEEKILRQANFFVKLVYEPPVQSTGGANPVDVGVEGVDQGGFAVAAEADRVVGVTNTEYGSVDPVWGTNANRAACPYNAPRLQHQVSGATRLDVVSDVDFPPDAGTEAVLSGGQEQQESSSTPTPPYATLAFNFYVPAKDLESDEGGSLRLHLFQNTFSLKAGIVDAPVGYVTIPLSRNTASTVHKPEWKEVDTFHDSSAIAAASSAGGGGGGGGIGDFLSEWGEQQRQQQPPPQVLVGVNVQARKASVSRPGSPSQRPPSFPFGGAPASSPLGDGGPAAYGGGSGVKGAGGLGAAGRISLGAGEWTKVEEDSDSDEEVADEGAAAAAAASTTAMHDRLPGSSENLLSRAVSIQDCYEWLDLFGAPRRVLDKDALITLFSIVDYPLPWVESHAGAITDQVNRLSKILDVYRERVDEGASFRSSLLKKEPLLQYVATNLHIQVWSIRDPVTGVDRNYDFVTTGAPAAHALGHAGGGLVTLQAKLQALGVRVMELQATRKECKDKGGAQAASELEGHTDKLRATLLEFESLSGRVSMRRACVMSQAVSIAATSFCAKLEMMARGTLDVAADVATGGCGSYDDLSERWTTTGFLLGFEGLLSIHGKEHGMVEDTVSALDMLADYELQISVGASVPEWMHPALTELETAVRDDKVAHKNTAILLEAQLAVRRLCGGRVTFCKSGKDRTAMSVTLEEALLLAETTSQRTEPNSSSAGSGVAAAVSGGEGWRAAERSGALGDANVLREHGCRLLVAEKNVGRPLYSFNALQRQFIPELYQPPPQTIQDRYLLGRRPELSSTSKNMKAKAAATKPVLVEVTAGGLITNAGRCELSAHAANAIREAAGVANGLVCKLVDADRLRVVDWSGVAGGALSGDIGAMLIYAGDDFKDALAQLVGDGFSSAQLQRDDRLDRILSMLMSSESAQVYGVNAVQEMVCAGDRLQLKAIRGASKLFLTQAPGFLCPQWALVGGLPLEPDMGGGGVTNCMPKGTKMVIAGPGWHTPRELYLCMWGAWNYIALIAALILTRGDSGSTFILLTLVTELVGSVIVWWTPHRWSAGALSTLARADPVHSLLTAQPSAGFTARVVMVIEALGGVAGVVGLFSVYTTLAAYILAATPTVVILVGLLSPSSWWARFVLVCFAGHMFEFAFEAAFAFSSDNMWVTGLLGSAAIAETLTSLLVLFELSKAAWATFMFTSGNPARCKAPRFLVNGALASLGVLEGTAATLMQTTAPGGGAARAFLVKGGCAPVGFLPPHVDCLSGPDVSCDGWLLLDEPHPASFSGQIDQMGGHPPGTWATGLAIYGGGVLPVLSSVHRQDDDADEV